MNTVWEQLLTLFDLSGFLESDFYTEVWAEMNLQQFLLIFLYIMMCTTIVLAVFRLIGHISDLFFSNRWLR